MRPNSGERHTPARRFGITDGEVIEAARAEGFEFGSRFVNGEPLVGFTRGGYTRYPAYRLERLAISYMRD